MCTVTLTEGSLLCKPFLLWLHSTDYIRKSKMSMGKPKQKWIFMQSETGGWSSRAGPEVAWSSSAQAPPPFRWLGQCLPSWLPHGTKWELEVWSSHWHLRLADGWKGLISLLAKATSFKAPSTPPLSNTHPKSLPDPECTFHWPELNQKAT